MKIYPEKIHRLYDAFIPIGNLFSFNKYALNNNERYGPFFIVGSGRSGNTLLRKLLNNHSAVHIPPETYVLGSVINRFRQNAAMKWPDLVDYVFSTFEYYPEFETFGLNIRPLVQKLKNISTNNRNLAFLLNSFYQYHGDHIGVQCARWGDKTPYNTFFLERILSVFPDAKFIHMLRDGVDVVSSYMNAKLYDSLEKAVERWCLSVKLVGKFQKSHPDVVLTVRYEEFVTNPQAVLLNICDFLEIDFELQILQHNTTFQHMGDVEVYEHHANVLNPVSAKSIGKGRSNLTLKEKVLIQKMMDPQLIDLGYDKCMS